MYRVIVAFVANKHQALLEIWAAEIIPVIFLFFLNDFYHNSFKYTLYFQGRSGIFSIKNQFVTSLKITMSEA